MIEATRFLATGVWKESKIEEIGAVAWYSMRDDEQKKQRLRISVKAQETLEKAQGPHQSR